MYGTDKLTEDQASELINQLEPGFNRMHGAGSIAIRFDFEKCSRKLVEYDDARGEQQPECKLAGIHINLRRHRKPLSGNSPCFRHTGMDLVLREFNLFRVNENS